jgi:hypothetical protein
MHLYCFHAFVNQLAYLFGCAELRCRSAGASLLGLPVRLPAGRGMDYSLVNVLCCAFSGFYEGGGIPRIGESYRVCLCPRV